MSDGGKGSKPRPILIDKEEYKEKWNTIFGEKPILTGYCDTCGKKESWCQCNGISVDIKPVEDDHLGGSPLKQTDFEVTVKKTWEF